MSGNHKSNDEPTPTTIHADRGGVLFDRQSRERNGGDRRQADRRSGDRRTNEHGMLWYVSMISIAAGFIFLSGWALRATVATLGDSGSHVRKRHEVGDLSHASSAARQRAKRRELADQIREDARQLDRKFMRDREYRIWMEETRERPDNKMAIETWQREVESIEKQLAEAKPLQDQLGEHGPLSEGTVLWHRMRHLEKLREDAPLSE